MRILIDIGHPAHVHLFKHFAWEMLKKKHEILFTCRDKEFEIYLLKEYGFSYRSFGKKYLSIFGKVWGLIEFDVKSFLTGIKYKPDIFLSHGSMYAAHTSFLLGKPHISFEDTFNFEQIRLYLPFTKVVLTGNYKHPLLGQKELVYSGYHELAYLHPRYFTVDYNVLERLGLKKGEKFVILRFVAWNASHDFGSKGISYENRVKCINEFEKYAKVFISSEGELPVDLKNYQINILPHEMHDALALCSLLFGESSTMSEECAMLGTPSIFLNQKSTFYTQHLENSYSILFNFSTSSEGFHNAVEKGKELLVKPGLLENWQTKRQKLLNDTIDLTALMVWFVENWPESFRIMKENPDYQERFKIQSN